VASLLRTLPKQGELSKGDGHAFFEHQEVLSMSREPTRAEKEVKAAFARRDFLFANVSEVDGPLDTKCLEWQRSCDTGGYGRIRYKNVDYSTHRLAWIIANGPIPVGQYICHRCDYEPCCNVLHHFIGSNQDNQRDAHNKGRSYNGNPILTVADVANIKGLLLNNWFGLMALLSRRYGVSDSTIRALHAASVGASGNQPALSCFNADVPTRNPIRRRSIR
jgi:hypothetical protein